jgi:hypothetical protein
MPVDLFVIISKGEKQITLDKATRKGTLVFSVTNKLDRDVKMRAKAKPQQAVDATLTVKPDTGTLRGKETTSISVEIEAPNAALGSYGIELLAWDNESPNEFSSKGPVATFEVAVKPGGGERKVWPWILVAVGGLLVLGLGGWLLVCKVFNKCPRGPGLHEACKPADPAVQCKKGLKCMTVQPGVAECLLEPGSQCSDDLDCSIRWCRNGKCNRDDNVCQNNEDCHNVDDYVCTPAHICRLRDGKSCGKPTECEHGYCISGLCTTLPRCTLNCQWPTRCQFTPDGSGRQECSVVRIVPDQPLFLHERFLPRPAPPPPGGAGPRPAPPPGG